MPVLTGIDLSVTGDNSRADIAPQLAPTARWPFRTLAITSEFAHTMLPSTLLQAASGAVRTAAGAAVLPSTAQSSG